MDATLKARPNCCNKITINMRRLAAEYRQYSNVTIRPQNTFHLFFGWTLQVVATANKSIAEHEPKIKWTCNSTVKLTRETSE